MSQPVSVALCTRNGAQFIEAQLGSILNQSVQPHEIVSSDDIAALHRGNALSRLIRRNITTGATVTCDPQATARLRAPRRSQRSTVPAVSRADGLA